MKFMLIADGTILAEDLPSATAARKYADEHIDEDEHYHTLLIVQVMEEAVRDTITWRVVK